MALTPKRIRNNDTGEIREWNGAEWVTVSSVPKLDPTTFQDTQRSIQDLNEVPSMVTPFNTGLFGKATNWVNQSKHNLEARLSEIADRGALARIAQMKTNSGTNLLGANMSDRDLNTVRNALGNFTTDQDDKALKGTLSRAKDVLMTVPGSTEKNPIDLSGGQSRTLIPQRAWYRDPYGNIRRNDNYDKGNPKLKDMRKSVYDKYGLEK